MKRSANFFIFVLACYLLMAVPAQASRSVPANLEGCVIKGVFCAVEKKDTATGAKTQVYRMEVRKPEPKGDQKMNLSRYEGKKISVQGRLLPGDVLIPGPKGIKVLGKCGQDFKKAIAENE